MIDFQAAYTGLTFAKDAFKFVLEQKIDLKVSERISEAMEKIGKVQDDLFQVREDLLRLQEENHRLKEELREKEAWDNRASQYELIKTEAKAIIYRFNGEPAHFACPVCMVDKQIQILQEWHEGTVKCPKCKSNFDVENVPEEPPPPPKGRNWVTGY